MKTFWLVLDDDLSESRQIKSTKSPPIYRQEQASKLLDRSISKESEFTILDDNTLRLVSWCEEILQRLLKQIKQRRNVNYTSINVKNRTFSLSHIQNHGKKMVIDEVSEIIVLPDYDPKMKILSNANKNVDLDLEVVEQLGMFVNQIASLYRDNPCEFFEEFFLPSSPGLALIN